MIFSRHVYINWSPSGSSFGFSPSSSSLFSLLSSTLHFPRDKNSPCSHLYIPCGFSPLAMKVDTPDSASTISMTNTITITVEQDGIYEINGARQEPVVNLNMVTGASKLRKQLRESDELIVCPGVYDGLSARIAINMGFKGMYMVCPS